MNKHNYRDWYRKARRRLIKSFGGKCVHCGETDPKKLEFAHERYTVVSGRGRGSHERLVAVREHPHDFQLLCHECHRIHDESKGTWCHPMGELNAKKV